MARKPKQSQKQSQIQQVVVNVAAEKAKPKRKRRPRQPKAKDAMPEARQLPPVAYFISPASQAPASTWYEKPPASSLKKSMPFLEDVGSVGASEIVELPTKKEQLDILSEPVSGAIPLSQQADRPAQTLSSTVRNAMIEDDVSTIAEVYKPFKPKPVKLKKERLSAMKKEDIRLRLINEFKISPSFLEGKNRAQLYAMFQEERKMVPKPSDVIDAKLANFGVPKANDEGKYPMVDNPMINEQGGLKARKPRAKKALPQIPAQEVPMVDNPMINEQGGLKIRKPRAKKATPKAEAEFRTPSLWASDEPEL